MQVLELRHRQEAHVPALHRERIGTFAAGDAALGGATANQEQVVARAAEDAVLTHGGNVDGVVARTAEDGVRACPGGKPIVTSTASQTVVATLTGDAVRPRRTDDGVGEHAVAAEAHGRQQRRGVAILHDLKRRAAAPHQPEGVVRGAAMHEIVAKHLAVRAGDRGDEGVRAAPGADVDAGDAAEVVDGVGAAREHEKVVVQPADDGVVAGAAVQGVVSRIAIQGVVAAAAQQLVVTQPRDQAVVSFAAIQQAAGEDRVQGVVAGQALHVNFDARGLDHVVPGIAYQVGRNADDGVLVIAIVFQVLDVIGQRVAAQRHRQVLPAAGSFLDGRAVAEEVDVVARPSHQGVGARAGVEVVSAGGAGQFRASGRMAGEDVVVGQVVVQRRAELLLDGGGGWVAREIDDVHRVGGDVVEFLPAIRIARVAVFVGADGIAAVDQGDRITGKRRGIPGEDEVAQRLTLGPVRLRDAGVVQHGGIDVERADGLVHHLAGKRRAVRVHQDEL